MWSQFKFPLSLFGCIGSTMCLRAFQMTEMGFLTQSSAQRTTTRNEPTSASSVWWPCLATALWLTRSYRYAYIISHYIYATKSISNLWFEKCWITLGRTNADELVLLCLQSNGDLKRKWTWAVEWLGDELERRPYTGNPQYTYNNWSPPVQSNETSNGYFLERSHSARMTLAKACELCPEEVMPLTLYTTHTHTHTHTYTHTHTHTHTYTQRHKMCSVSQTLLASPVKL